MIGTENEARTPAEGPVETTTRPRVWSWLALGVLVIGAIAYGLARDDVLLEDDFSTPATLRTWPYDVPGLGYEGDAYHVTVTSRDTPVFAVHELPRDVDGLAMTVSIANVRGEAVAILECSTEVTVDESGGTAVTEGYLFLIEPATGSYAITDTRFTTIRDGTLTATSRATVGCASDGSTTTLTLQVPGRDAIEVDVPGGRTFEGISLGAVTPSDGAEVAFDDLRVTEANR